MSAELTVLELCAGAGGQALGLEEAGFRHIAAIELDSDACATLTRNRPEWRVIAEDVHLTKGKEYRGVDVLAAGVPCPPFSIASRQLGADDERDLFPQALRVIKESKPGAVLLENVRGFATARFDGYRAQLEGELEQLGYSVSWRVLNASSYGVPQLRPRFVLVALRPRYATRFRWPEESEHRASVGQALGDLMGEGGWPHAPAWSERAVGVAPTIVGGSKKHGGPDLGPTRAKVAWRALGVDGLGIADVPPGPENPAKFLPRLTVRMVGRLQGFPDHWQLSGRKTAAYRQVGNAFPPPVARAVGGAIREALAGRRAHQLELG